MNCLRRKLVSISRSALFTSWNSAQSTPTDGPSGGADKSAVPKNQHEEASRLSIGDTLYAESSWDVLFVTIVAVTETEAHSDHGYRFHRIFKNGDSHINGELSPIWDFIHWVVVP